MGFINAKTPQEKLKERLLGNGMFVPEAYLDLFRDAVKQMKVSNIGVEILGDRLLDGTPRRTPDMVGIRINNLATARDYDRIWEKVCDLRDGKERK